MEFQIKNTLVLIGAARTGKTVLANKIAKARGEYQVIDRFSVYDIPNEIINTLIIDDVSVTNWKYVLKMLQKKRFFYRDNSLSNKLKKMPRPPLIIITANELPQLDFEERVLFDLIEFIGANTNIEVADDSFNVPRELQINYDLFGTTYEHEPSETLPPMIDARSGKVLEFHDKTKMLLIAIPDKHKPDETRPPMDDPRWKLKNGTWVLDKRVGKTGRKRK